MTLSHSHVKTMVLLVHSGLFIANNQFVMIIVSLGVRFLRVIF